MRLLFVLTSLHRGGAERHTIDLACALAAAGHECLIVSIKAPVAGGLTLAGMPRCELVSCDGERFADNTALRRLRQWKVSFKPDVIVAASSYALVYAWLVRGAACLAVIFHTTRLRTLKDQWLGAIYRRVFARADLLVFVCEDQRQYWQARGMQARRVEVIHNGIDPLHFAPARPAVRDATRAQLGLAGSDFVIGITAAFRPEKNHVFLIRALPALVAAGLPACLLMVGDGPLRSACEREADALGVSDRVRFAGAHDDVRPFVAAFDVFALASTHIETFPLSALEAMAMGVPAVLSDVGGVREMVESGRNGYLYPVDDQAAFVSAIARLRQPALRERMGAAARRIVEARFTHAAMVALYAERLRSLLPVPAGAPPAAAQAVRQSG